MCPLLNSSLVSLFQGSDGHIFNLSQTYDCVNNFLLLELTSDTPYIIGGAIGGLAAIMIIALITISIARCLKG